MLIKKQNQAVTDKINSDNVTSVDSTETVSKIATVVPPTLVTTEAVTNTASADSTEKDVKVAAVIPATPITAEGIFSSVSDSGQAKKIINQGYAAVYYSLGDTKPAGNSTEAIGFVLTYLRNNPSSTVDIIGSTDQIGTDTFNENLATERAQNLKDILVKAGVSPSRMTIISKGKDNSVDVNSDGARSLVRTVKFMIKD